MKKKKIMRVAMPLIGLVIIFIYLFPVYWMLISSFKDMNEIFAKIPTFFPKSLTFESYKTIFSPQIKFYRYFINSLIISTCTMIFTIILGAPAAYALARKNIKGLSALIGFVLIVQMFPPSMMALPIFSIFSKFNLTDSYLGVIIANMTVAMPFAIVVMRTFFVSLPKELEESAMLDGCSSWGTFIRIILPVSKTGVMTCAAFSFVFSWGEFMYSLVLLNDQKYWPITLGLRQFDGQYGTKWNELMAVAVVCSLPVVLIFLFLQKYIISGVTAGSVKG